LKNNGELLNNLGNFINRSLVFVTNNFGGKLPKISLTDEDKELLAHVSRELNRYVDNLEQIRIRDGIRNMLAISTLGNQYMQANKPWVLVKGSDQDRERAGTVLAIAVNMVALLSVLVSPYMPELSETIEAQLNCKQNKHTLTKLFTQYLPEGHQIGEPKPLFQKIEPAQVAKLLERFGGKQNKDITGEIKPGSVKGDSVVESVSVDEETVKRLTLECTQQGEVVRKLKAEKADKVLIDAEVSRLMELKGQLSSAQGIKPEAASSNQKKKKGKK